MIGPLPARTLAAATALALAIGAGAPLQGGAQTGETLGGAQDPAWSPDGARSDRR